MKAVEQAPQRRVGVDYAAIFPCILVGGDLGSLLPRGREGSRGQKDAFAIFAAGALLRALEQRLMNRRLATQVRIGAAALTVVRGTGVPTMPDAEPVTVPDAIVLIPALSLVAGLGQLDWLDHAFAILQAERPGDRISRAARIYPELLG